MSLLDSVVEASGGANVISSNNDIGSINWVGGLSDPGELIKCGFMPEARRLANETDEVYQKRLEDMDMPNILGPMRFAQLILACQKRANLAVKDGKVCMFGAGEPWWHGLGTRVDKAATSKEAMELASLAGWNLQKLEQYIDFNAVKIGTGSYAVVRGDNGTVLTKGKSVGKRYQVFGNEDLFAFADEVVDGVHTRYETAGALGDGEKVWMLASMPELRGEIVEGDAVDPYILFTAAHDGSGSIICFQTSNRVVCGNSYSNAMKARNGRGICIRHTANVKQRIDEARKALGLANRAATHFIENAKALAQKPMSSPVDMFNLVLDDVIDVTIAEKKVTSGNQKEILNAILEIQDVEERADSELRLELANKRRKDLLEEILNTYENERCNGMQSIKGTAWAAVNAVSEAAQHGSLVTFKGSEKVRRENHMESVIDGRAQEITQLAMNTAMAM